MELSKEYMRLTGSGDGIRTSVIRKSVEIQVDSGVDGGRWVIAGDWGKTVL